MRKITSYVPGLLALGAVTGIGALVALHVQGSMELEDSHERVPLSVAKTPIKPKIPDGFDQEGCRVLPDHLRICDAGGEVSGALAKEADQKLRFPDRNKAERPPRAEALRVIEWIIRSAGVARNFEVLEGDFKGGWIAFAAVRKGRRVIVYDAKMFDWGKGRVRWAHLAIMAHEIAHHLNGDTTGTHGAVHSHEQELAADFFAGFIVARLGGTLDQALSMSVPFPEGATPSHPDLKIRRDAITRGWKSGPAAEALHALRYEKN